MGLTAQEIVSLQRLYHRLDQTGLCIQLQLVGDGSTAGLGRQYHEDDDQPGIIETGYLPADAVASVLRRLDVFIGLYDDGASGRRTSLAAAFAHGLCIVSTDGPNTDHALFRHGENCLLVPYGDNSCLHTALLTLIGDPDLREQLGRCAYETYRQEMAWPVIAGKIMEAIGES
jgi:glycosyltransferase involved in cell wall biosynthesis